MSEYLLSTAIGPVQDFIAAARRCRDLAFGSYLLSEVSKGCARYLREKHGATLIFPTPVNEEDDLQRRSPFMAVNKLLVQVTCDGEAEMRTIVGKCREHVERYLAENELDAALGRAQGTLRADRIEIDREAARRHLESLTEFYAAWAELGTGAGAYEVARETAERRMAARKALRNFAQHQGKAGVHKSSLDGFRETVLGPRSSENQYYVRRDEQLDGVGLLKRFGGKKLAFDSTIDVAAVPYVQRVKANFAPVWTEYEKFLSEHSDTIPSSYGHLYPHASRQLEDQDIRAKLERITQRLQKAVPAPPYYVLLIGDGDYMGQAISTNASLEGHQKLSRSLSQFAKDLVKNFPDDGECVYAGGDDVMALLPLHRAMEYALQIRNQFNERMKEWGVTFSAGMVVAHALEPLDEVRRLAHDAERKAKAVPGKNALCITVSPRSGADVQTTGKWDEIDREVRKIARFYVAGQLSKGLGHELRALLNRWKGDEEAEKSLDDALPGLARAIADKKEFSSQARDLVANVKTRGEIQDLVDNLFVARPFARAMREAGEK